MSQRVGESSYINGRHFCIVDIMSTNPYLPVRIEDTESGNGWVMALREKEGIYRGEDQELRPNRPLLAYDDMKEAILSIDFKSKGLNLREISSRRVHPSRRDNQDGPGRRSRSSAVQLSQLERESQRRGISLDGRGGSCNLPTGVRDRFGRQYTRQRAVIQFGQRRNGKQKEHGGESGGHKFENVHKSGGVKTNAKSGQAGGPVFAQRVAASPYKNMGKIFQSVRDITWGFVDGVVQTTGGVMRQDVQVQIWEQAGTGVANEAKVQTWSDDDNHVTTGGDDDEQTRNVEDKAQQSWNNSKIGNDGGEVSTQTWSNSDGTNEQEQLGNLHSGQTVTAHRGRGVSSGLDAEQTIPPYGGRATTPRLNFGRERQFTSLPIHARMRDGRAGGEPSVTRRPYGGREWPRRYKRVGASATKDSVTHSSRQRQG